MEGIGMKVAWIEVTIVTDRALIKIYNLSIIQNHLETLSMATVDY